MADWTSTMQQTFEYYIVDPGTWKDIKKVDTVVSSKVSRDSGAETLGSASITLTETIGECYMRIYLITIQNGVREKHPLGTFLVQTPSYEFDGKNRNVTLDAYTPLLELKEKHPPIGYAMMKDESIMERAYDILAEQMRAPVVRTTNEDKLQVDFVANLDDTWMTFLSDLIMNTKLSFELDEMGRVLFAPYQDLASMQPVWTFDTGNSSILMPKFTVDHDLYGIPNVVEVIYSNGTETIFTTVVNDDPNSPVSTINRGRRITHRITNPEIAGNPSEEELKVYATRVLRELSSIVYTISYEHGYCPVRVGDCVRLNYAGAGLSNVKAKVIKQDINCVPGCPVTETAVFTDNLWEGI